MKRTFAFVVCNLSLFRSVEHKTLALVALAELGDVVQTKHHILRRHGDRSAVGRVKDVVRAEHQQLCLEHCLVAERQVNCHLVTVEVGVERRTCQRVQLDSLALDHTWLECLDTKTVKCRGTVKKHRMTLHHVFKDIPYNRLLAVYNLLGALHCLHNAALNKLADDKRFIKFGCHVFWQTAFMHLQFRTYNDYRTR